MNEQITHLQKIIANRRTIKPDQFTGEKVNDELINQILEVANWAPTHGYTEPWRFTVFAEEGLATLGDFLARQDQPDVNAEGFNRTRFDRLRNRPLKCSHVIGIGMKRGNNPKVPEIEEICAVAMAVQNMWLMAHTLGLGAYWSTGAAAFTDEMRDFFGLEGDDRSMGLFYIGKPAMEHPKGRRLSPITEKVHWVRS
ncbi:MAG TPA: nitroreductase [Cryomorphaceae bacterium]|nr:nitroreductase [Owenweeksia sp.]MBG00208.1 nitroreductase [Owenweeksia sp.]HAD97265.1 nitroreductase [Cryomorphaceae bacterium]HBF20119.1 nitroreductase [Cryomorphaceae bacterium]|tara:strand:+ start:1558 stop:2148 length:591 start_codon:yes stop_codon:yes gene_type:complete